MKPIGVVNSRRGNVGVRFKGEPLAGGPDLCLASFDDKALPTRYLRGVLWVGFDRRSRKVKFTEGVRLLDGAVDYASLHPEAQKIWSETEALLEAGHSLPVIE